MQKIKTLLKAPVLTQSGYGVHSRQIFDALMSDELFDVYVESLNWGNCSFITENTIQKKQINQCIDKTVMAKQQGQENYDLFIHVTIPNEFERRGRFNVGVTAGIETDRVSHIWIQKCNEMDLNIVPSEHSRKVFQDTIIDWENPNTKERGSFRLEKPMVVCAEGVDTTLFRPREEGEVVAEGSIANLVLESDFNFLHVGQWGNGNFGEDRKNISLMLKYFLETFRGRKDVGLVLKTNMSRNSEIDYVTVKARIESLKQAVGIPEAECPPIYLIHANLTSEEMSELYKHPKIKAFITLTHGEGFGIPVLEAAASGLPVIATNWSGHLDMFKDGKFIPVEYEMKEIPDSIVWENVLIKGSKWAVAKEEESKRAMEKLVRQYSKPKEWAKDLLPKIVENFDIDATNERFVDTIKQALFGNSEVKTLNPIEKLASLVDTPDSFNVIYTMPMSTGDVFVSTAVIDGLMKQLPEDSKVYFATDPKYFDLLKGNPQIYKCIPWDQSMLTVDVLEQVFDLALTPNTATQYMFSNWVRRGQGRLLAEEFANHCQVELGDYFIGRDDSVLTSDARLCSVTPETVTYDKPFITFHPGSGQGQWEGRGYRDWDEVLNNLKGLFPDLKVVQVGMAEEPLSKFTDVDLRGKTTYQQLASVTEKAVMHLGIDSFNMHLAAALNTPLVAIFGCSYASSTGPWVKNKETAKFALIQSERLSGCKNKACYKNKCKDNPHDGAAPINEIDPRDIFQACAKVLMSKEKE